MPNQQEKVRNIPIIGSQETGQKVDIINTEEKDLFDQFVEDIADFKIADASLQILLRKKLVNLDEAIASAREKISKRMEELEETLLALKGGEFIRDPQTKYDDIDEEFQRLMANDKDKIESELECLKTTYRVTGHLLRAGIVKESDAFIRITEALFAQIKKSTPQDI